MTAPDDLQELAKLVRANLLAELTRQRQSLGLTKLDLAQRIGRNRATVFRAEGLEGEASVGLTTFCELAVGMGLTPMLVADDGQGHPDVMQVAPGDIVHRGRSHNRTRHDLQWRDRQREAALARAWEAENDLSTLPADSLMAALLPNHTQAEATAAATAIQWLGTDFGLVFLTKALEQAGYVVLDTHDPATARATRLLPRRRT